MEIVPFLWFDGRAFEAARFYTSIFPRSRIETPDPEASDDGAAAPTAVTFWLDAQKFIAFNGGPHFAFTPAISLFVSCETQAEIDDVWRRLGAGGAPGRCGWLTDKFGVSWQIVPRILGDLLGDADEQRSERVMHAMLQMEKLEIAALQQAYERG